MTYDLLDSTTLTSSASSVTFSNIDQSYGDLVLIINGISVSGNRAIFCRVNSDSGSNYSFVQMQGNGTDTSSFATSTETRLNIGAMSTDGSINITNFLDYSATDKHKSVLSRQNADFTGARALRWADTSSINTLNFFPNSGDFDTGSSFYLYGIAK